MPKWLREYVVFLRFSAVMLFVAVPAMAILALGLPLTICMILGLQDQIFVLVLLNMVFVMFPAIFWFANSPKTDRIMDRMERWIP